MVSETTTDAWGRLVNVQRQVTDAQGRKEFIDSTGAVFSEPGDVYQGFPGHSATQTEYPALAPLKDVTDFLKLLTSPNLWIRVGEFIVGAILLGVGLSAMLKPVTEPAMRTARKAATFAATKKL